MTPYINAIVVGKYTFDIVRLQCVCILAVDPEDGEMVGAAVIFI